MDYNEYSPQVNILEKNGQKVQQKHPKTERSTWPTKQFFSTTMVTFSCNCIKQPSRNIKKIQSQNNIFIIWLDWHSLACCNQLPILDHNACCVSILFHLCSWCCTKRNDINSSNSSKNDLSTPTFHYTRYSKQCYPRLLFGCSSLYTLQQQHVQY